MCVCCVIGDVRLYYNILAGTYTQALTDDVQLAMSGLDFLPVRQGFITINNGDNTGIILAQIYDDDIPEVDEVFLVNITHLELVDPVNSAFKPALCKYLTS